MAGPTAQRSPSPNVWPTPPFDSVADWKNRQEALAGMPLALSVSVSALTLASPVQESSAPAGSTEFAQPRPDAPALPHGHAPLEPSPSHTLRTAPPTHSSHSANCVSNAPIDAHDGQTAAKRRRGPPDVAAECRATSVSVIEVV